MRIKSILQPSTWAIESALAGRVIDLESAFVWYSDPEPHNPGLYWAERASGAMPLCSDDVAFLRALADHCKANNPEKDT